MPVKITKEKFIQTLEDNELGLTNEELATLMKISLAYFYVLRGQYRKNIRDHASDMAQATAMEQISNLKRNAAKGDTNAAVKLLEMAGSYIPASKQKLEIDAENVGVIVVPEKKPVGAPVE